MRTNIDIDDALLAEAMDVSGLSTKRATVEEALRQMVETHRRREALASLAGVGWEGDLDAMRLDKARRTKRR
ncbi:MAG: type II toxin-antitoxin system VapB family antitoxin [Hyphomonadaceae bacterium]